MQINVFLKKTLIEKKLNKLNKKSWRRDINRNMNVRINLLKDILKNVLIKIKTKIKIKNKKKDSDSLGGVNTFKRNKKTEQFRLQARLNLIS
jgi:ribonuclease I